jgi:5'-methylthioadenosine phosphorylase
MNVAIIGGTGIDEMAEFSQWRDLTVETRFGSALVVQGTWLEKQIYFVPRHGRKHNVPPSQINYRAQIAALRKLDVQRAIGVCAVGSLKIKIRPGDLVVLSDFIDLTRHRPITFYDAAEGPVAHTDMSRPYCEEVSLALCSACASSGVSYASEGVYVGVDGPRYETPSEIRLYAEWGGDVVGMTNVPEAVLAREAGICYGALALVANYGTGLSPKPLSHNEVRAAVIAAESRIKAVLSAALGLIPQERKCACCANSHLQV